MALVTAIKELLIEGDSHGISLIRRKKDLLDLKPHLESIPKEFRSKIEKALYWFEKPVQVRVREMKWYKDGTIRAPGGLVFELCDGLVHQIAGWNDPNYPPPGEIERAMYEELVKEIKRGTGLVFQEGCNDVLASYKVGHKHDDDISPEQWLALVDKFVGSIKNTGYSVNLITL